MAAARQAVSECVFEVAEKHCLSVLEIIEDHCGALLVLGTVYARTGRIDPAIATLQKLVSVDPKCPEGLNWLAALYRERGNFQEAVEACERAVHFHPRDAESWFNLGTSLCAALDYRRAVQSFKNATALRPNVSLYWHHLVSTLVHEGRDDEALRELSWALQQLPFEPHLFARRISLLLKTGELSQVIQATEDLRSQAAEHSVEVARSLAAMNDWNTAERVLRNVLARSPKLTDAQTLLAEVLQHFGKFDEAKECLLNAITNSPAAAEPYFHLVQSGKVGADLAPMLSRVESMSAEPRRPWQELRVLHYALGKAYDDLGVFERAMPHFDEGNRLMYDNVIARQPFNRADFAERTDEQIVTFTREFLERHRDVGSASERPIFIVGMMRSGTTLVKQILSSHPDVGAGSEIRFWAETDHRCLDPEGKHLDPARVDRLSREYLSILEKIDASALRVTDKMPHNYRVLGRIHAVFPNARIIHCRRHPVDTCLSIWVTPFHHAFGYSNDRSNIVFAYREYQRLMAHWRCVLPTNRFLEIEYEDLVSNRESVVRQIVSFCGLEWDDACLHHECNHAGVQTASLWQVRQPIYESSVGRWRNYEPWLREFRELL